MPIRYTGSLPLLAVRMLLLAVSSSKNHTSVHGVEDCHSDTCKMLPRCPSNYDIKPQSEWTGCCHNATVDCEPRPVIWAPANAHLWGWLTAGIAVLLSCAISLWSIAKHLSHNRNIALRNATIRIILMVPVYAITSYCGLLFRRQSPIFEVFRDCYEAFVIFSFMDLLLKFLDGPLVLAKSLKGHEVHGHLFPMCCLPNWEMGPQFVHHCMTGVFQYSVAMPIMTLIAFFGWMINHYCPNDAYNPYCVYVYVLVVHNLSQLVAMYCLVLFYHATRNLLAPINPLGKLLCIKAVVL
jgi:hypothetical protein